MTGGELLDLCRRQYASRNKKGSPEGELREAVRGHENGGGSRRVSSWSEAKDLAAYLGGVCVAVGRKTGCIIKVGVDPTDKFEN